MCHICLFNSNFSLSLSSDPACVRFRTAGRWFWVGLNKRDPERLGSWEWSDGSPVSVLRCFPCGEGAPFHPVSVQVVTSFIEDKNEDDDRRACAVYGDLTNALMPRQCDTKHEWICKLSRGKRPPHHRSCAQPRCQNPPLTRALVSFQETN